MTVDLSLMFVATLVAQAIAALAMAILLSHLDRTYRQEFLRLWSLAWLAGAVFTLSGSLALAPLNAPAVRVLISVIVGVSGYVQLAFLYAGARAVALQRNMSTRILTRVTIAGGVFGGLIALATAHESFSPELRYFARIGVRALVAGIVLLVSALLLRRAWKRGAGTVLLTLAVAASGLQQLHYFVLAVLAASIGRIFDYTVLLGFLDIVLNVLVAVGMVALLLEHERDAARRATVEIEHLAYHDPLTGLPNRHLFLDRLRVAIAQASRQKQQIAVFFLDLDRFKDINDALGHSTGDQVLRTVADRINTFVRQGDTLARFGGDEFSLLVQRMEHVEYAAKIAQKVLDVVRTPVVVGEREFFISTSVGVSIYPLDGEDPETLVKNADSAMYRAKENGRDNYQLHAPALNQRNLERIALEGMLRRALGAGELTLHYQPVVELSTNRMVSVEALLRWKHPELGLLYPAHFISIAEISGLIVPIGEWVLRTACRDARNWQRRGAEDVAVSVNLSARQFQQFDLVMLVRDVLRETGLPASLLQVEITESHAMQNVENSVRTLLEMKALGVRIAMDDFGTGYSSLSYLKRLPIDTLKLDQSFVRGLTSDPGDGAIAAAVLAMAHSLGIRVVAEGVETEPQLEFLRERGCDQIQGFYVSQAVPTEEIERLIPMMGGRAAGPVRS